MESHFAQDILDMLQGSSLLQLLNNPAELRGTIAALENAIELLKENEQRLYPEQAPKSGKSRRNEIVSDIHDPAWQRDKILRVFQRTHQTFTSAQLHGQYIKNVDSDLLEARCDELVALRELAVINSKRSEGKKYCLPSDAPPEPKLEPIKPKSYLQLGDQSVGVYRVSWRLIKDTPVAYVVNREKSLLRSYKTSYDRLMAVPHDLVFLEGTKEYETILDWLDAIDYDLLWYEVVVSEEA
jgi:hypothetical protein